MAKTTRKCTPSKSIQQNSFHFITSLFYTQVQEGLITDERVRQVAYGPSKIAQNYPGFIVNGYRFHTKDYGQNKSTMNSGVCVKGSTYNESEYDYYGIVEEILQLQYLGQDNHIFLFKCHWFDPNSIRNDTTHGIVELKHKSKLNTYEPFILATQAQQVYYTSYPSCTNKERNDWWVVCRVKSRLFSDYELDMTDQTAEEINAEFFQEDFVEDVELTTHIGEDESEAPMSLSHGNEVEEVDPREMKDSSARRTDIEYESSGEEEEYTSDECEDDDEDGVELDISSSSEEEMDIN